MPECNVSDHFRLKFVLVTFTIRCRLFQSLSLQDQWSLSVTPRTRAVNHCNFKAYQGLRYPPSPNLLAITICPCRKWWSTMGIPWESPTEWAWVCGSLRSGCFVIGNRQELDFMLLWVLYRRADRCRCCQGDVVGKTTKNVCSYYENWYLPSLGAVMVSHSVIASVSS